MAAASVYCTDWVDGLKIDPGPVDLNSILFQMPNCMRVFFKLNTSRNARASHHHPHRRFRLVLSLFLEEGVTPAHFLNSDGEEIVDNDRLNQLDELQKCEVRKTNTMRMRMRNSDEVRKPKDLTRVSAATRVL